MTVQRVWFVRHGETDYNAQHLWQGQLDVPLNAAGIEQAERLAAAFPDEWPQAIYSSDLSRAYDTARPLASMMNLPIIAEPRLREMHVGVFQGLSRDQISGEYGELFEKWRADDAVVPPQGESRLQLQQRVYEAFQEIIARDDLNSVMLVSHGGSLRLLFRKLFPQVTERWHFGNTSLSLIERDTVQDWRVVFQNRTSHLD